ncbi:MAG: glycosyltransferase family 4 protein [Candidatus Levybacteria bacterium]|nr:glycosyltransferase family 4 protein [Candidatus Levybacteria bacterium]
MIIGIDGNEANTQKRVGIGEYAFELLKQFSNSILNTQNSKFTIYLKEKPLQELPITSDDWCYRIITPKKFWTQIRLPVDLYIHRPQPDIFFSPTHYAPRFSSVPTAISIMDLSYHYYPQLFKKKDLYQLTHWTAYSVKNASIVFTISKASKHDIIKLYNVPESKVVVTYPGIKSFAHLSPQVYSIHMLQSAFGITTPYFLFVGTLQPRKNIVRLIEAFAKLKAKEEKPLSLVIVGKRGWLYEDILQAPEKYSVSDSVKFLEFVTDEQLPMLYKNAICYVLPSLYEGFGLPVLEAMKFECPVIASNVSSLPEAGGDAALYVDPESADDIAKKMKKVLDDKKLRSELIAKGKKQLAKFSWEKTAKETLTALEEVVKKKLT